MAMSASTKNTMQRVVISLIYLFMGAGSLLSVLDGGFFAIFAGTTSLLTFVCAVITFIAGVFGLFKLEHKARIWMGVIIFVVALVNLVFSILYFNGFSSVGTALTQAAIAWLYILCN